MSDTFEAIKPVLKQARDSELPCKSIVLVFLLLSVEILSESFEGDKLQVSGVVIKCELEYGLFVGMGSNFEKHA